jgi:nucleotide-binding universal stress UspA family protein
MTRSVVVGFDGSPDATAALRWALTFATGLDATVTVVHARGMRGDRSPASAAEPDALIEIASELGLDPGRVRWRVDEGDPCSALLRTIDGPDAADVIVVGTRGHGRHEGLMLGSTSLEVVEHATVPVVVVPSPSAR